MAVFETGFFLLLLGLGFFFTFVAAKSVGNVKGFMHIVALGMFFGLAIVTASGYEVSSTYEKTTTDGIVTWNENGTNTFLPGGEDSFFVTYIFSGLGFLNLVMFVKDVWRAE